MIRFVVMGDPKGKQRARQTFQGGKVRSYTPAQTVQYEKRIAWVCKNALRGSGYAAGTPLCAEIWCYMPIPKSASKSLAERLNGEWHTKKPDGSNILKSVEDALNQLAYEDDAQIAAIHVYKVYDLCPRVEVKITELDSRRAKQ